MSELNELQFKLCQMLKFFHSFCLEHKLSYYVLGGTMLGAVRHKGFIPWDDDADVGMPRKDYERLREFTDVMQGQYVFETVYSDDRNYCYPFSKLYDTTTTLIENSHQKTKRGIYIDIFPLDGIGNTENEAKKNFDSMNFWKNMLSLRTIELKKGRAIYKNIAIALAQSVPNALLNDKNISLKINEMCKKHSFESSSWGGNLIGAWGWKEVMKIAIYGTPRLYQFEDFFVYGVENAEAYLTHMYGNWKELPPVEKRYSHHDRYLDLKRSYLD